MRTFAFNSRGTGGYWTWLGKFEYYPPGVLVRDSDLQAGSFPTIGSDNIRPRFQWATWTENDGTVRTVRMRLLRMPEGAATIQIGSVSYSSGVASYTPSVDGQFITEDGVLASSGDTNVKIAGLLLTDYFLQWDDDPHRQELHRVEELKAGDLFWVIAISSENPDETWQVRTTGPVNDGDPLIIDTDGKVQAGPAASTASVVAYSASQVGRIFNRDHLPVAIARETIGAAGLVSATIYLLPKIP